MVQKDSALGDIQESRYIDEDHMGVCKPTSRTSEQYKPLVRKILEWVPEAAGPRKKRP